MMSSSNDPFLYDQVQTNSHKHLLAEVTQLFSCAVCFYSLIILQLDEFQHYFLTLILKASHGEYPTAAILQPEG